MPIRADAEGLDLPLRELLEKFTSAETEKGA